MKKRFVVSLAMGLLVVGNVSLGQATTMTVNNIDGDWANPSPAAGITISNDQDSDYNWFNGNDGRLAKARWGTPQGSGQSGYNFVTQGTSFNVDSNGDMFAIGTFTHLNYPITGTSLDSIDLKFYLDIAGTGDGFLVNTTFKFDHNETPNSGPNPNDIVTIANPIVNQLFTVSGTDYYFNLFGFSQDNGGTISTVFSTIEGQSNTATLFARITEAPINAVPEPATMLLFGTGLACLASTGRRRGTK